MKKAQLPRIEELSLDRIKDITPLPAPRKFLGTKNPRYLRVILALWCGPLSRKELDRVANVSNGPALVAALRRSGFELPFRRYCRLTIDGYYELVGEYSLTHRDRWNDVQPFVKARGEK